jgi:hypothetical protein
MVLGMLPASNRIRLSGLTSIQQHLAGAAWHPNNLVTWAVGFLQHSNGLLVCGRTTAAAEAAAAAAAVLVRGTS